VSDLAICPNCGCNLRRFEPIRVGGLEIEGVGGPIRWKSQAVKLTPSQRCILIALASHLGRTVAHDALINAAGCSEESLDPHNILRTMVRRIRDAFQAADPAFAALRVDWGLGYRWQE
jgi:two-component system OmpR family response regulator